MIVGIFHKGSGLGNQLHRYVATRCLAIEKGEDFGMVAPDLFKGDSFLKIDKGVPFTDYVIEEPSGKVVAPIETIDGEFQGEEVWEKHIDKVREWLKPNLSWQEDCCVISHRGGEYKYVKDLYLPKEYWDLAISKMTEIYPNMKFRVVTDDVEEAQSMFPNFPITHEISHDWSSILGAKYLILSNSSFAILPAYLNESVKKIIAPLYWAGYNNKEWVNPDNNYKKFEYIHHESDK